ncbi:hypothetical protein B6I21_00315 [candidate division KSB1 bacterium 4572_119]|nr:MAG: hypothetical protein B6I21_00315 [candidate division KSB1 bacterium 4572_119]
MKYRLIIILFLTLLAFTEAYPAQSLVIKKAHSEPLQFQKLKFTISDSWFGRDKAHHFLTSAFLSTAGYYYFREINKNSNLSSKYGGVSISLSLGLAKEIRDGVKPGNAFSWKDLIADILGTAAGIALVSD